MGSQHLRVEDRAPTAPAGSALAREVADRIASLHVPNRTPPDKVRPRSGVVVWPLACSILLGEMGGIAANKALFVIF